MGKSYSELILLLTIEERYEYLRFRSNPGEVTFGGDRYLNQMLYGKDRAWLELRHEIMVRDNGCDLAVDGYPVGYRWTVHHINPLTKKQILDRDPCVYDPENLILCSFKTHNAIHYGKDLQLGYDPIVRTPNDTCPWKL